MLFHKHAYLIVAHGNPQVLEKLIQLLDDERNDIYIHIDKKVRAFDFDYYQSLAQKSKVSFTKRIDVRWGNVSLTAAELTLFRTAYQSGTAYQYYHLISGSDLPIKSQDHIHRFFESNAGREFIGFSDDRWDAGRVGKIHLFARYLYSDGSFTNRAMRKLRQWFVALQAAVGYDRTKGMDRKFVFGSNWVSVTHNFVGDLLKEEQWILRFYKHSNCSDEVYKPTFAYNSSYRDRIYDMNDELRGNMRLMDWRRGRPFTFRNDDFDMLMASDKLFARKFEDKIDVKIVDRIYTTIIEQQEKKSL